MLDYAYYHKSIIHSLTFLSMAVIIKQDLEATPKGPFDGRLDPLSLLLLTGLDDQKFLFNF